MHSAICVLLAHSLLFLANPCSRIYDHDHEKERPGDSGGPTVYRPALIRKLRYLGCQEYAGVPPRSDHHLDIGYFGILTRQRGNPSIDN